MKIKRVIVFLGSAILVVLIFMIYSARNLTEYSTKTDSADFQDNKWLHFESRIKQIENDLNEHHNAVHEIKEAMKQLQSTPTSIKLINNNNKKSIEYNNNNNINGSITHETITEVLYDSHCSFQIKVVPRTNIQMLDLYHNMKFDNPDGGVWKQGWKIEIDEKDWNKYNRLKVFVVPHSHNDPGWIKTIEDYYVTQTKHILYNMLKKLPEDPRRKFIWAEISYFAMWWEDLGEDERETVKKLVKNNQLEIVSGGWVMNDEANSLWVSNVQQMTEGHQWLHMNLHYTPKSSWSIDPFGMSLNQPLLLKHMGLKNLLIQRVHYSVKKELAKQKQLEFRWRQLWDSTGETDLLTQLMPFYSYDIPHTCGPDPKICCQFDFKRLPGHGLHCPWRIAPQEITDKNVRQKAELLLDQYRKKSQLYKTNVLLIPLGDDFRYDHITEWDVQYNNYQKLFDYMNSNLKLYVHAQFGTLSDYFDALRKEKSEKDFPTLSGDFFTYADRDDHYWSGYYTSRPLYKHMDRVLVSYVRAAETILAIAHMSGKTASRWISDREVGLEKRLSEARKALALFQHHDGITGTAKTHVMEDYAKKMLTAINASMHVIQHCAHILFDGENSEIPDKGASFYNIDDVRHSHDSLAGHYQITIGPELKTKRIALFNSLRFTRTEVVTFHVSTPFLEVVDSKGQKVQCQISPIFEYGATMSQTKYRLSFIAIIPPLGLMSYIINALYENETPEETVRASIKIYNQYSEVPVPSGFDKITVSPSSSEFTLRNDRITASFNQLGLLKALKTDTKTTPVHLDFLQYGARHTIERSGAYLFLPDGDGTPIQIESTIVNVIIGPIYSSVTVQLPYVHHTVILYNSKTGADSLGLEIKNIVDVRKTSNFEIAMRLSTNIDNVDEFFTDVNGFEIVRRKTFKKLPLQANYYPMPTMAYIEDKQTRLTIVTSSPLGCGSLQPGQIEVMMDRRLNQDDNLGLGQGVTDNQPVKHTFRLLLERRKNYFCQAAVEGHTAGFPTLSAYVASQTLLNPLVRLLRVEDHDSISKSEYIIPNVGMGIDFSLPIIHSAVFYKEQDYIGFVLHRQYIDTCFAEQDLLKYFPLSTGNVNISNLFPQLVNNKIYKSSLSFLYKNEQIDIKKDYSMCPMQIQAFIIER